MNRFILFALFANTMAQAQQIYLPDPAPGARVNTLTQQRDGVFLLDSAAGVRATMEGGEVVVRFPVIRTAAPKVKGVILVDSLANSELTNTPKGLVLVENKSASKSESIIHVILEKARAEEPVRVVVLESEVFWDVRVNRVRAYQDSGWLSLPLEAGQKAAQCLQDAARVFDAAEKRVLDLRLTKAERAQPVKVGGQLTEKEIAEIRRLVFAMARQQILEHLAEYSHDAWPDLLREWPGRHELDIRVAGQQAAVYYAPNAGYQMEKIDGKWTIVGG